MIEETARLMSEPMAYAIAAWIILATPKALWLLWRQ